MSLRMASPFREPKTGVYYCRVGVPESLRPIIGKREFKISLRTKDPAEARIRFTEEFSKVQTRIENAKRQLNGQPPLQPKDVTILLDRWLEGRLQELESRGSYGELFHEVEAEDIETGRTLTARESALLDLLSDAASGSPQAIAARDKTISEELETLLASQGLDLPPDSSSWQQLKQGLMDRYLRLIKTADRRLDGKWEPIPHSLAHEPLSTQQTQGLTIIQAWNKYCEVLRKSGEVTRPENRINDYRPAILGLAEVIGDKQLCTISPDDIRAYRDLVTGLPSRPPKAIKQKPLKEQAELAEERGLEKLSNVTVRNRLMAVSALFEAAKEFPGSGVTYNPVQDVKKPRKNSVRDASREKDFTREELDIIFGSPWFTRREGPPKADYGEAFFWIPLILYYTGARREEIAQLKVADVRTIDGIPAFHIRAIADDQSAKNVASVRLVPIHQDLLKLGFMEYAQAQPKGGDLWPKLKANQKGSKAYNLSRRYSVYLKGLGIDGGKDPLHGFRHTFKTLGRSSQIPRDILHAINGHSGASEGDYYGKYALPLLAKELTKFPSVPHLETILKATT